MHRGHGKPRQQLVLGDGADKGSLMSEMWSGLDFLESVDGPMERFPVARVLFLAHRVAATGRLTLQTPGGERVLLIAGGGIAGGAGFPDLLREHGVRGLPDETFVALVGRAIAAGVPPDEALASAQSRLGELLAELVGARGGRVQFGSSTLDASVRVVFADPIPRMLSNGLRALRPASRLRGIYGGRLTDAVSVHIPDDSPETRWGLDAVSMRLLRDAGRGVSLGDLLGGNNTLSEQTLTAVDLLVQLGLLSTEPRPRVSATRTLGATETRPPRAEGPEQVAAERSVATRPAAERVGPDRTPRAAPVRPAEDPLRQLKEAHARLKDGLPADVLGLVKAEDLSESSISRAYRELSARYHPDRHRADGPEAVGLAGDCFSWISEAFTALKDPALRKDEAARLTARAEGRTYISESQKTRARICFARAEVLVRNRRWAEALPELDQAVAQDPGPWRYQFLRALAAHNMGRMTAEETDRFLRGLAAPDGEPRADVLYEAGEILLKAGKEQAATNRFREALASFPEHVPSKRRVWLQQRRADNEPDKKADPTSTVSSVLSSIFSRRGKS